MTPTAQNPTRSSIRKQLRSARRALSPAQQKSAAAGLAKQLRHFLPVLRSKHIAFYLPNDGEIDPRPLISFLERCGKQCYLPRLHADGSNRVWFVRYRSGEKLSDNRFGIPEPRVQNQQLPAWAIQTVLMPLVGFDRNGNRLGMGGGFYDRTFAFKHQRPHSRPLLIGLAHSVQEVAALPTESWDMPLDMIATEKDLLHVQR
jgi:5-formyltetrahydrofolate cyclo-ligase